MNLKPSSQFQTKILASLKPHKLTILNLISPSLSLLILLLIRLFSTQHFNSSPSSLDFGPKNGITEEPNIAFVNEPNSYGHCLQGVLSALFCFPSVCGTVSRWVLPSLGPSPTKHASSNENANGSVPPFPEPDLSILLLTFTIPHFMSFYISYNLFKRLSRDRDTFATSSFLNNSLEWVLGFCIGVLLGGIWSWFVYRWMIRIFGSDSDCDLELAQRDSRLEGTSTEIHIGDGVGDDEPKQTKDQESSATNSGFLAYGKIEDYITPSPSGIRLHRPILYRAYLFIAVICYYLSLLFMASVLGCATAMALTWDSCMDGKKDCVNYVDPGERITVELGFGFVGIVFFVWVTFYFLDKRGCHTLCDGSTR